MLEYLRNAADKLWAKVLMFILIFSFVGWGAAEWIFGSNSRDTTIIRAGGEKISIQQFNNERSRQLSMMSKDEQRSVYTDPVKSQQLIQSVMSGLTMNQLLLKRASDLGFVVSDKRIANEIRQYPQFQNRGNFSSVLFDRVLQSNGLTEQDFADILRTDLMRQMVVAPTMVPLPISDFVVDAAYNARYLKRGINYSTIRFSDFKTTTPTEEELKSYYAQNPTLIPEKRSVSYVFLQTDMNKPDAYDEGLSKAQKIEDMIISGESMNAAANKYKAKFVTVPAFAKNAKISDSILTEDLVSKIYSMDAGAESELLELKNGFAILRVDDVIVAHNADFNDVKKDIISAWKKAEQRKSAYMRANEQLIELKNSGVLKGAQQASVSRTDGAPLVVLKDTFNGKIGDNIILEDKDAFYVLHIDKDINPKVDNKKKESLKKELERISNNYVQDDYSQFLKRHYSVKVNDKVVDRFITK